jgi:hypothetical protein
MATYKGYDLVTTDGGVEVYHPRTPAKPVYVATDAAHAKRWVSAYRDGTYWAVMEAQA